MDKIEKAFSFKGCRPVTLFTRTKVSVPKSNPFYGAEKLAMVNGMVGGYYANAVNNALEKKGAEPDFTPGPRKWGNRISGTPFVEHKGKKYLEMHPQKATVLRYVLNGKDVPREEIEPHLRKGSDKPIVWRDYTLANIIAAKVNGDFISREK